MLFCATVAVSFVSDTLVKSIEPVVAVFGWTELFIGVVFVAVIGNISEHLSAVTVAMKNRMDLSLQISVGSATQIIMLVAPILVIVGYFLPTKMTLLFSNLELISMFLAVIIANIVVSDGESNWFEGLQLIMAYVIMAVAFFFHP